MPSLRLLLSVLVLACGLLVMQAAPFGAVPARQALVLEIQGPIGPAVAEDVTAALAKAGKENMELVILRMDTPGGLDKAMRAIIQAILASSVPVVSHVAPRGARAASAGTYILYASHIAAMAPATNLGGATPVRIGGLPGLPEPASGKAEKGKASDVGPGDAMHAKMVNDAAAYLRALANLRGRNADWAEKAVREAASLSAKEALKLGVIDVLAADTDELLSRLDGRRVRTSAGERTLHTRDARLNHYERGWRSRLLAVLTDPNIAYILMLLGIYGLFFELANPGFVLPGVIGGICLVLALFAFQLMPVSYAGLALILLGIAFMVAEAFVPSFGALGLGGVIAFVIGSIMLMDRSLPGYAISMALILAVALASAAFFILVVGMALKARRRPVRSGAEELIGMLGVAAEDFEHHGRVHVHGEDWQAESLHPLHKGQPVRVVGRRDLTLLVQPVSESASENIHSSPKETSS